MTITIEEAKAFIVDAERAKQSWQVMADRSWMELKKRQRNNKLWSITPNSVSRRARYPAWYSIFKIRQPLILARIGIPIGKDTTQDGNDNIGATAAICLERLAVSLAKTFDFFDVMSACRDDFLATNFSLCRGYYERDEVKQKVKEYIQPQKTETGAIFVDADGKEIQSDNIMQDDEGYFIEHSQVVDIENEKICLEHVLYKRIYVDPGILRWNRCKRLAFEEYYSVPEFKAIFGAAAYAQLPNPEEEKPGADEATPKRQSVKVFEYWDEYEAEVLYWPDNGKDFIKPLAYLTPDNEEYSTDSERHGLYDLEKLFPVPNPLIMNAPTDEFWPVPEYYQMQEMIEDIHLVFSRMVAMTKAIRPRLLFDDSIEGLKEALNEATTGDAFGVSNLASSLAQYGGSLEGVVQYIPVQVMVDALGNMYTALDQRLQSLFRLTGTSDLLQGLSADNSGKTLGERQIEEKYATNQLYEPQRKMAEFVRGSYQLMCEMALKNFKDASLDMYIMPQTLQPEDQQRYRAALGMLKDNQKRFRIELETDSTIALNEEYDKKMRIELVNTLTAAIEKTANVAQNSPALVAVDLHAMKFLIQGFKQGKMFQSEITEAIDNVIKQAEEAAKNAPPPFNKDEVMAKLKAQELKASNDLQIASIQSRERIEMAKLNAAAQINSIQVQLDQFKLQVEQGERAREQRGQLQLEYAKINASIQEAQQKLLLDRDALMVELRKVTTKQEADQFAMMVEQQTKPYELQLEAQKLQIDQAELQLRAQDQALKAQEQAMVDSHVNTDNILQQMRLELDAHALTVEANKPPTPPDVHIHMPQPVTTKKKVSIQRDEMGNMTDFNMQDVQEPVE